MKILIADDDHTLVRMLSSEFASEGLDVLVAYDAVQAWIAVRRHVPGAVILDLTMPGGSGIDILKRLKVSTKTRALPVIVVTASTDPELHSAAKTAGADYVFPKPLDIHTFVSTVLTILGLSRRGVQDCDASGARMRAVVADDDPAIRHTLKSVMTKWGYDVISASTGQEAWDLLRGNDAPSMAIIDWMMPGMSGIEVCRQVRELADEIYTYIILLTSRDSKVDVVAGLDAGADDYIAKPVDVRELRARIAAGKRILDLQDELLCQRVLRCNPDQAHMEHAGATNGRRR